MLSVRYAPAPVAHRRLLRSLTVAAAVASGALAPVALPAAAADESVGTTVAGRLVQAWAEAAPAEAAAGHADEGPISWVQPAEGDPVLVDTAGVSGVPVGSTVAVTVGAEVSTDDEHEGEVPRTVLDAEIVASPKVAAPAAPAPFTTQVTIAMVAPAGSNPKGDGTPLAQVTSAVTDRVAPFWSEQTGGAISLGVTATHDWAGATVDCEKPGALWDEVAARVNFVPGPGKHLLLYVSRAAGCAYALAEVGTGPSTGGRLYVTDTSATALAHEFGHNFGLGHSSAQQCDGAVETGICRTVAYRDYYDVMGVSWAQTGTLNAAQAALLEVLPEAQQQSLSVRGSATTATLAPLSGRTGTRALRLTDAEGTEYWLEYRTATGRDSWLASGNRFGLDSGVLLRRAGALPDTSVLLDGTPSAAGGWGDDFRAALPVGVAVPVSGGGFSIVVQSVSSAGALVSVTPTPPATPSVTTPTTPGAPGGVVMAGSDAPTGDAPGAPLPTVGESAALRVSVDARAAERATPELESVARTTSDSGALVAVGTTALAGAVLLCVRRKRRR